MMNTYADIVNAWGRERMASDFDVPKERVRSWERFNTFPVEHWKLALKLAPNRNIEISPDLLIDLAAKD